MPTSTRSGVKTATFHVKRRSRRIDPTLPEEPPTKQQQQRQHHLPIRTAAAVQKKSKNNFPAAAAVDAAPETSLPARTPTPPPIAPPAVRSPISARTRNRSTKSKVNVRFDHAAIGAKRKASDERPATKKKPKVVSTTRVVRSTRSTKSTKNLKTIETPPAPVVTEPTEEVPHEPEPSSKAPSPSPSPSPSPGPSSSTTSASTSSAEAKEPSPTPAPLTITIRHLRNGPNKDNPPILAQKFSVTIQPNDTVAQLKQRIHTLHLPTAPPADQHLFYRQDILQNNERIDAYRVRSGEVICLVAINRGHRQVRAMTVFSE